MVGVYATPFNHFPWGQIFDKGLSLFTGQAPVQHYLDTLLDWVQKDHIRLDDIITHRLPLENAVRGYEIFDRREEDCRKVVLRPGASS